MEQEKKTKRENIVTGLVGAFLGSLIGVVCTVVIGQMGYVASVSGLIMAVGALKGYELLGGQLSKKGAVISSILVVAMTYLAHRLTFAVSLVSALNLSMSDVFLCFQAVPGLVEEGAIEGPAYWGDLAMLYLFTLLGAVPTIISGLRAASLPDFAEVAPPVAREGEPVNATFYPGQLSWMRPLRISAAVSVLVGVVPMVVLAFAGVTGSFVWMMASVGCMVSAFVMICVVLPQIQLCTNSTQLLVRVKGTVWKVNLPMLNSADTYRFTKRTGAVRAIRWDILNQEEQERAKTSVMRAITLLSSGQVMAGSLLGAAVLPLAGLQVVKENRWCWKCAYSLRNGKMKRIVIPKAYSDFAPISGMEAAQGPVPPRWELLGIAVALAVVLGCAGAGIGAHMDGLTSASRIPGGVAVQARSGAETPSGREEPGWMEDASGGAR